MDSVVNRRQLLAAGLAAPLLSPSRAVAASPVPIADMHFHLFLAGPIAKPGWPLAKSMAEGGATLVSWSLVGDAPWLEATLRGYRQKGAPKPGQALAWLEDELGRMIAYVASQGLKLVRGPDDVDRAMAGEPHIVLSLEGATSVEEPGHLAKVYDLGIRHVQPVHYIANPLGDFQTEAPVHGGLAEAGKAVIAECNRLGILVDLAHMTSDAVAQALAASKAPVVWSHGSVTRGKPHWSMAATRARQLTLGTASLIAAKGGVVGLWGLRSDTGPSFASYADRLAELADLLGEDHVAFGTDMNVLTRPVISGYGDLRRVVEHWQRRGMSETRIRKLSFANYARVLRGAMAARSA